MRINIDGIVGFDVLALDIRAQLEEAAGENVELLVSSPGGSVYEGLAVYNALRDYKREGGKITARVVGLAASMASYIPMVADTVSIEDNAVWMIHNPYSIALGDYREMKKNADILDGIAKVLGSAYAQKTGMDMTEIREMMDDETYLFGQEIIDAGFADQIEPAGDGAEDKDQALALAGNAIQHMREKLFAEPENENLEGAAAMLNIQAQKRPVVDRENKPASEKAEKTEVPMDKEKLMQEHPAVYNAIAEQAKEAGVQEERARVNELHSYIEADPDNLKLAEVVNQAIADGSTANQVNAKIQVAIRDGGKLDGENPPDVETVANDMEGLDEEDKEAMQRLGYSAKEYKALIKEVK